MTHSKAGSPRSAAGDAARRLDTSEQIAGRLDDVERKLERLRALYEAFFAGIERRPPQVARTELNRLMLETQQAHIRNAALRFRYQSLAQRWVLLTTYWNRTLREIESGCYRRDLERAYRRLEARGAPLTVAEAAQLGIPANRIQSFVTRQNRQRTDGGKLGTNSSSSSSSNSGRASQPNDPPGKTIDFDRLHAEYMAAHTQLRLATSPPDPILLQQSVEAQIERLRSAHPNLAVDVSVIMRDGKAIIAVRSGGPRRQPPR